MNKTRMVLWTLVFLTAPAHGRSLDLPTAPLRAAFEEARENGAVRSEALAHALLHAVPHAANSDPLLQMASQADPQLAEPHLRRARRAARRLDIPGVVESLGAATGAVRLDARQEALWLQRAFRALHLLLWASLATYAMLLALRSLPLARHVIGERVGSPMAATLLLGVPLVSALALSLSIGILVLCLAMATFLRRRERGMLAVLCVLVAVLDLALFAATPHATLLDPRTHAARVARLNDGVFDPELAQSLDAATPSAPVQFVLGLQARRRGDVDGAHARYVAALRADSAFAPAYVNLSNLFFRAGDLERAAAGYRAAQALAPSDPIPYANLAQTYIRMLHYGESDHELRAASARGFAEIERRVTAWRDEQHPVLDVRLSKSQLLALAGREVQRDPRAAHLRLQTWQCAPWQAVRLEFAPWLLFGTALLLLSRLRLRLATRSCSGCSELQCAPCLAATSDEDLCAACAALRPRLGPRPMPGPEPAPSAAPRRAPAARAGRWIAPLFPGAADVVRGDSAVAVAWVFAAWSALLLAHAAIDAARLRTSPWYAGVDVPLLQLALVTLGLLWLTGLWRARRMDRGRRVPNRGA